MTQRPPRSAPLTSAHRGKTAVVCRGSGFHSRCRQNALRGPASSNADDRARSHTTERWCRQTHRSLHGLTQRPPRSAPLTSAHRGKTAVVCRGSGFHSRCRQNALRGPASSNADDRGSYVRRCACLHCRLGPQHVEHTPSRPIWEVKQRRAPLVPACVSGWEYRVPKPNLLQLLLVPCFVLFVLPSWDAA